MGAPISPVVSGLLSAFSIGNLIKRNAMAEREMKLREHNAQQGQMMRDIEMAIKLPQFARPVENGRVTETLDYAENMAVPGVDTEIARATGIIPGPVEVQRQARPGAIPFRGQQWEPMTMGERADEADRIALRREMVVNAKIRAQKTREAGVKKWTESVAEARAKQQAREDMLRMFGVDVPNPAGEGSLRVLPEEVAALSNAASNKKRADNTGKPRTATPNLQNFVDYSTGDVTPTVATVGEDGKPIITIGERAKGIAKPRPRGAQGGASAENGLTRARTETLKGQAQKLHTTRSELGRVLAVKDGERFIDGNQERTMNKLWRSSYQQKFDSATSELQAIEGRLGGAVTKTGVKPASAPSFQYTATDPKTGKKVGWDGTQWLPAQQ